MKKPASIFSLVFFIGLFAMADSDVPIIGKGTALRFNSILKTQIKTEYYLRYDNSEKTLRFILEGQLRNPFCMFINDTERMKLLALLGKYQEWNKKATTEGVELEKEIGTFSAGAMWDLSGDAYQDSESRDISVIFFSQNTKVHQFVLKFPKYRSSVNQFITDQPDDLYLNFSQAKALEKQLTNQSIRDAMKKANKKKLIADEFK